MQTLRMTRLSLVVISILCLAVSEGFAQQDGARDPKHIEFFETKIRPVLVEQCYKCHNSAKKSEGGLALDHRKGLRAGGDRGPAIVVGKADKSLLIQALRHEGPE